MTIFGYTIASIASVVVSFIGFVVGMRAAKERADRAILRQLYQELYVHFRSIRDAARRGRPKDWANFNLVGDHYEPFALSLERDGRISMLPKRLADEVLSVERDALKSGYEFKKVVGDELVPILTEVVTASVNKPTDVTSGRGYVNYQIGELTLGQKFPAKSRTSEDGEQFGVGIELALSGNSTTLFYIYQEKLRTGTIDELLQKIEAAITAHQPSQQRAMQLRAVIDTLEALLKRLAARIKDPNPFFESLSGSAIDMFRR